MIWLSSFTWELTNEELQARFDERVLEVGVIQATNELDQAMGWPTR